MKNGINNNNNPNDEQELRYFRLEDGQQLNRNSCVRVCERFFARDAAAAAAHATVKDDDSGGVSEQLLAQAKKMYEKLQPEHDTISDPITVEIRSVPVKMYCNALRHYYVRLEDVLEVHPGVKHRLALAWWHNTTVLESDVHERSLKLCGTCCDELLDYLWNGSERFNIVWNNCDQLLNRCEQSFALGVLLINCLWFPLLDDYLGLLLMLSSMLFFLYVRRRENVRHFVDSKCNQISYCSHAYDYIRRNTTL